MTIVPGTPPAEVDGTEPKWVTYYDPDGTVRVGLKADVDPPGGQTLIVANDEDVTVPASPGTTVVLYTALTAARVVNLPPASGPSQTVIVRDVNGLATGDNTIQLVASGGDTIPNDQQLIDHTGAGTGLVLAFTNDGVSAWYSIDNVNAELSALMLSLGGTDGDGNVYSIEYDPTGVGLALKVAVANGDIAYALVDASGDATLVHVSATGDVSRMQCSTSLAQMFFQASGGEAHLISVSDGGVVLDGVLILPTGGSPGDVLTVQADGSIKPQTP